MGFRSKEYAQLYDTTEHNLIHQQHNRKKIDESLKYVPKIQLFQCRILLTILMKNIKSYFFFATFSYRSNLLLN